MANISRIANVSISLDTTPVSEEGFSTLLVVGYHPYSLTRMLTYTDVDSMVDDGFSTDDLLYVAVSNGFDQTPRPSEIKVGRRQVDGVKIGVKTVSNEGTYKVTVKAKVNGSTKTTAYSYTGDDSATTAEILAGLQEQFSADTASVLNVTVSDDQLVLSNKTAGTAFTVAVSTMLEIAEFVEGSETIAETMAAIKKEDSDWYGWALTSRTSADIMAAAAWTETQTKLFGTAIAEEDAIDASVDTDTGSKLMAKSYYRTHWWYHEDAATEYPEVAIAARCFSIDPGGETWANKKLSGITVDTLSETEYNAVTGKNGNTFEKFRSTTITQNGKVAAGEWIDVIRFRDWLQEEIATNIFTQMVNSDKIPYTDAGIAIIEAQIRKALVEGQTNGGIAPTEYDDDNDENPGFTISVPLNYDVSTTDKSNRELNDVSFTARLAGAIHVVNVTGSLTYESLA